MKLLTHDEVAVWRRALSDGKAKLSLKVKETEGEYFVYAKVEMGETQVYISDIGWARREHGDGTGPALAILNAMPSIMGLIHPSQYMKACKQAAERIEGKEKVVA